MVLKAVEATPNFCGLDPCHHIKSAKLFWEYRMDYMRDMIHLKINLH